MQANVQFMLEQQVNREMYSAYLYLAIANYYFAKNLDGFGHWFQMQAKEELAHAIKILDWLRENDVEVKLTAIDAPKADFNDLRAPLVATIAHEQLVTKCINDIYKEAQKGDDFSVCQFLDWFIAEQVEEESSAKALLARYDLATSDLKHLAPMDADLGKRTTNAANSAE